MKYLYCKIIRHIGAIGFLAIMGLVFALIPLALFSILTQSHANSIALYFFAAFCGGSAIGWVLRQ